MDSGGVEQKHPTPQGAGVGRASIETIDEDQFVCLLAGDASEMRTGQRRVCSADGP